MIRVVVVVAAVLLMLYCVIDLAQTPARKVRVMPRWLWAVAIVGLPVLGGAGWLGFGRPTLVSPPPRLRGPDDDEEFLRGLRG